MERPTAPCAGCWLHVTQPTAADLATVREFGVPAALLDHVSDIDERPRVEHVGECVLVVMNYPLRRDGTSGPPWRTLPLSVLLTPRGIVTLSQASTTFLQPLLDGVGSYCLSRTLPLSATLDQDQRVQSMLGEVDVAVYASGSEKVLDLLPDGVEAIEYLHVPEAGSVNRLRPLLVG